MKEFESLHSLICSLANLIPNEWVYANLSDWRKSPKSTTFYYIPWQFLEELEDDEIYLDDEDLEMPISVKGKHIKGWMTVNNIEFITKRVGNTNNALDLIIDEINFYREFDTFRV